MSVETINDTECRFKWYGTNIEDTWHKRKLYTNTKGVYFKAPFGRVYLSEIDTSGPVSLLTKISEVSLNDECWSRCKGKYR